MPRGQLPKAYLRMDPDLDAKHPDNLAEFIRLMCAANRQPRRGRFRSLAVVEAIVGRRAAKLATERGDFMPSVEHECGDCPPGDSKPGELYLDGWDTWQEGDRSVAERMRNYRGRKRNDNRNGARNAPGNAGGNGPPQDAVTVRLEDNKASSDDDPPNPPDDLELLTDDLLAPSRSTPNQLRAVRNFARAVGTDRTLDVLRHWRGQPALEDRFTLAFEQLEAEADAAKDARRKPSKYAYMDAES